MDIALAEDIHTDNGSRIKQLLSSCDLEGDGKYDLKIDGCPILLYACKQEAVQCVTELLDSGFDSMVTDDEQYDPLSFSLDVSNKQMVALLVSGWKDAAIDTKLPCGLSLLMLVCKYSDIDYELVKHLIDTKHPNIKARFRDGKTALHLAAENGREDICELLLFNRASVNVQDKEGNSPLHYACTSASSACIRLLIQKGANVNLKNQMGSTPLHELTGSAETKSEAARDLLDANADLNQQNVDGNSPLMTAIDNNNILLACVFLEAFPDLNIRNNNGDKAVHMAGKQGFTSLLGTLIIQGADLDDQNNEGVSPLYYTCEFNHSDAAILLINNGVNLNSEKADGTTSLDMAARNLNTKLMNMLSDSGAYGRGSQRNAARAAFEGLNCILGEMNNNDNDSGYYHGRPTSGEQKECSAPAALYSGVKTIVSEDVGMNEYHLKHLYSTDIWPEKGDLQVINGHITRIEDADAEVRDQHGNLFEHPFDDFCEKMRGTVENIQSNREILSRMMDHELALEIMCEHGFLTHEHKEMVECKRQGWISGNYLLLNFMARLSVYQPVTFKSLMLMFQQDLKQESVVKCIIEGVIPHTGHFVAMQKNRRALVENLDVIQTGLLDYCISKKVITMLEKERIEAELVRYKQTQIFIEILHRKSEKTFWIGMEHLNSPYDKHVFDLLKS